MMALIDPAIDGTCNLALAEFDAVKIKLNKQIDTTYGNPQFIVIPYRDDYF